MPVKKFSASPVIKVTVEVRNRATLPKLVEGLKWPHPRTPRRASSRSGGSTAWRLPMSCIRIRLKGPEEAHICILINKSNPVVSCLELVSKASNMHCLSQSHKEQATTWEGAAHPPRRVEDFKVELSACQDSGPLWTGSASGHWPRPARPYAQPQQSPQLQQADAAPQPGRARLGACPQWACAEGACTSASALGRCAQASSSGPASRRAPLRQRPDDAARLADSVGLAEALRPEPVISSVCGTSNRCARRLAPPCWW